MKRLGLPYFEKQKSGHWMTNFHETKLMAHPTFFLRKAGRRVVVIGLIVQVTVQFRHENWGDLQKKKKVIACHFHVSCHFQAQNRVNPATVQALTFFFFFRDHPTFRLSI